MSIVFGFLSALCSIYSFVIFIRILLTWFRGSGGYGQVEDFLCRVTDPYLDWFRRFGFLRIGGVDLSPLAAIGFLSLVNRALSIMARYGRLTLGLILAMAVQICWSAFQFLFGFCLVILALRLIAYLTSRNTFLGFWRVIDTVSQPIIYRINRIIFGGKIVHYLTGLLVSIGVLVFCILLGGAAVYFLTALLERLPI